MSEKRYYVYILMNNWNTTSYVGTTNNLERRLYEHKNRLVEGFIKKYNIYKLVFYEEFNTPGEAISAEKIIKGWSRKKKVDLIRRTNPEFKDLYTQ